MGVDATTPLLPNANYCQYAPIAQNLRLSDLVSLNGIYTELGSLTIYHTDLMGSLKQGVL